MNATATTTATQYTLNIGPAAGCHMYGTMSLEKATETIAQHAEQFGQDLTVGEFDANGIAHINLTTRPNPEQNDIGGTSVKWGILVKLS